MRTRSVLAAVFAAGSFSAGVPAGAQAVVGLSETAGTLVVTDTAGDDAGVTMYASPPLPAPVIPGFVVMGRPAVYVLRITGAAVAATPPCSAPPLGGAGTPGAIQATWPDDRGAAGGIRLREGKHPLFFTPVPGGPPAAPP